MGRKKHCLQYHQIHTEDFNDFFTTWQARKPICEVIRHFYDTFLQLIMLLRKHEVHLALTVINPVYIQICSGGKKVMLQPRTNKQAKQYQ